MGHLLELFKSEHAQSLSLKRIIEYVNKESKDEPFARNDIDAALETMMDANQVMVSDEIVFLI